METVCFDYTLQVVDVDNNYEYEYDGPPLALANDVEISAENDVNLITEAESTTDPTSSLTAYNELSDALMKFEDGKRTVTVACRPRTGRAAEKGGRHQRSRW